MRLWKHILGKSRLLILLGICLGATNGLHAEVQTPISVTSGTYSPGSSSALTASTLSGTSGSITGSVEDLYSGVRKFSLGSDGSGRFSTLNGEERYGVMFDQFQLFQSFLSPRYFAVVSAASSCPGSAQTYTWILVRTRTSDLSTASMTATDTSIKVGGVITYDSTAGSDFSGSSYFNLAGPTLTSTSYDEDRYSSGCSSAQILVKSDTNRVWDSYANVFFGDENGLFVTTYANPLVGILAPQVTLAAGDFSALNKDVLTGLYTAFDTRSSQTRYNVYLVPDSAGTTFTLRRATSENDPTSYASLGTLACTSLNSPANGFCSGTLTLTGQSGGAGNAVCQLSTPGSRSLLSCIAQAQGSLTTFVSIVAATAPQTVLSLSPASLIVSPSLLPGTPPTASLTVQNLTGRPISTLAQPSASGDRPQSPFAYAGGSFPGSGGSCTANLDGYGSCTIEIEYSPSAYATTAQTMKVEYNNGTSTVQATGDQLGTVGLISIDVTPTGTSYLAGSTQQFTATANYTGGGSEDITSFVVWSTNNSHSSTTSGGLVSWLTPGSTTVTATLGAVSGSVSPTVIPAVPVLTAVTARTFPSNELDQLATFSHDFNNTETGDDSNMSYTCVFDQTVDGAVDSGTNCTSLAGTISFNTSTGSMSWTPDLSVVGPYEFKVTGTESVNSSSGNRVFVIDVRPLYVQTNLRGDWDAQFADLTAPYSSANATWKDLSGNSFDVTLNNTTNATWTGSGTAASPYTLSLDGSGHVDLGSSPMSSQTKMAFSTWINPSSASSTDKVILTNSGDGTGNGFTVRQSVSKAGAVEYGIGTLPGTYQAAVLASSPVLYWRLGESSGSAADIAGNSRSGTYMNSPTLSAAGALTGDADTAVTFNGTNQYVTAGNLAEADFEYNNAFSVEVWMKTSATSSNKFMVAKEQNSGNYTGWYIIACLDSNTTWCPVQNTIAFYLQNMSGKVILVTGSTTINDGNWHHVVATYSGSGQASGVKIYVDGNAETLTIGSNTLASSTIRSSASVTIGSRDSGGVPYSGSLDEVAIYNTELTHTAIRDHFYAGIASFTCRSSTVLSNSTWNNISGLYDGSSVSLFVNGREECTRATSNTFTSPVSNVFVGATDTGTKYWTGKVADLKLYGTSDGSAVATSADMYTNFDSTADRYRTNPVGNIHKTGLVFHIDAANANVGMTNYANGCATADLNWVDLSNSALTGRLTNFATCGTSTGWNGNGTTSISGANGPYRLTFDGSNDYVTAGTPAAVEFEYTNTFSLEAWVNFTYTAGNGFIVAKHNNSSPYNGYYMYAYATGGNAYLRLNLQNQSGSNKLIEVTGNTVISDGNWHHVVATYSGSGTAAGVNLYVDGTLQSMNTSSDTLASTTIITTAPLTVGSRQSGGVPFRGHIAKAAVYNVTLTQAQVTQNCNAIKARFNGMVCN